MCVCVWCVTGVCVCVCVCVCDWCVCVCVCVCVVCVVCGCVCACVCENVGCYLVSSYFNSNELLQTNCQNFQREGQSKVSKRK